MAITAIFPGAFDPITNGHLDVVRRAARVFPRLVLAIAGDSAKCSLLSVAERMELAKVAVSEVAGCEVRSFDGLLVNFAREVGATVVVRGLRATQDFEYEAQMALMNRHLDEGLETVFFLTNEATSFVSSSLVKQVAKLGGDISRLVPAVVARRLDQHGLNRGKR